MPNWCSNYLYLHSDDINHVNSFLSDFKRNGKFAMNNIIPLPDDLIIAPSDTTPEGRCRRDNLVELYGYPDWYEFCISVWGTKWDISSPDEDYCEFGSLHYSTAWSPNNTFFYNISERYPDVEFSLYYIEPGMAFAGVYSVKNGNVLQDVLYQAADELSTKKLLDFINNNEHAFGDSSFWFDFFCPDDLQSGGNNFELEI